MKLTITKTENAGLEFDGRNKKMDLQDLKMTDYNVVKTLATYQQSTTRPIISQKQFANRFIHYFSINTYNWQNIKNTRHRHQHINVYEKALRTICCPICRIFVLHIGLQLAPSACNSGLDRSGPVQIRNSSTPRIHQSAEKVSSAGLTPLLKNWLLTLLSMYVDNHLGSHCA